MDYQILSVQHSGRADNSHPRIQFCGDWLYEIGFKSGALVQALPEPDGFVFNLCNENINYSELFHATKAQGGTLIRVYISNAHKLKGAVLVASGKYLYGGGLKMGDSLLAKYEYGCIRVRKVSGNVRLINIMPSKRLHTSEPVPTAFLFGNWLNDIGFTPDTLVSVASEPGCITFTAHDNAIIYSDIVHLARQNKMRLVQVAVKAGISTLTTEGAFVVRAGFGLGDIFAAEYEQGIIKLQKLDPEKFGF